MNFSKFLFTLAFLFFLIACNHTTGVYDNDGLDYIPGFNSYASKSSNSTQKNSSSSNSLNSSSSTESSSSLSSAEESSSSEEFVIDFSQAEILPDNGGMVVIDENYMEQATSELSKTLSSTREKYMDNEVVSEFVELKQNFYSIDDFDFSAGSYYCYTEDTEWLEITQESLLKTKLPFLWGESAYEYRDNYFLNFEETCSELYLVSSAQS